MGQIRNAWPEDMLPEHIAKSGTEHNLRIELKAQQRADKRKRKSMDESRKRNALIDFVTRQQRLGRLVTTKRSAHELVGLMPKSQVESLCRKFDLCRKH